MLNISMSDAEIKACEKELEIRGRYMDAEFVSLHSTEHDRAKEVGDSHGGSFSEYVDFSEKTNTVMRSRKILQLSKYFEENQPSLIVEYGAGASTVFIAKMLQRQYDKFGVKGKLISYEQSRAYYQMLKQEFPKELEEFCEMRFSNTQIEIFGDYLTVSYEEIADVKEVDLVYIDGPTTPRVLVGGETRPLFSSDLIKLVQSGVSVKTAATDVRLFNFKFFEEFLGNKYNIEADIEFKSIVVTRRD